MDEPDGKRRGGGFDVIKWAMEQQDSSPDNNNFAPSNVPRQPWAKTASRSHEPVPQQQRDYLTQQEKVALLDRLTEQYLPSNVVIPEINLAGSGPSTHPNENKQPPKQQLMTGLDQRNARNEQLIHYNVSGYRAGMLDGHVQPTKSYRSIQSADGKFAQQRNGCDLAAEKTDAIMELVSNKVLPGLVDERKWQITVYLGSFNAQCYWLADGTLSMDGAVNGELCKWIQKQVGIARAHSATASRYVFNLRLAVQTSKTDAAFSEGYNITVTIDVGKDLVTFYEPIGSLRVRSFLKNLEATLRKAIMELKHLPAVPMDGKFNYQGLAFPFSETFCFSMTPLIFVLECMMGDSNRVSHFFGRPTEQSRAHERMFIDQVSKRVTVMNDTLKAMTISCVGGDGRLNRQAVVSCDIKPVQDIVRSVLSLGGQNADTYYK